jgi:hypothetical protein
MLGKLCAICLGNYVHQAFLPKLGGSRYECKSRTHSGAVCVHECYFPVALFGMIAHNYKDTHGNGFPPARTPPTSLERTGRQPSSSGGCHRFSLSGQRVLRSERFGSGQVRDDAQRPEGRPCRGGGGPSLWSVPPGLLCHSSSVPARGPTGLLPHKRGPKRPHKLNDEAMAVLLEAIEKAGRMLKGEELAAILVQRCGVEAHPRSILRRLRPYLRQEEKKRR